MSLSDDDVQFLDAVVSGAASIAIKRWTNLQDWSDWRQDGWEAILKHPSIYLKARDLDDDDQAGKYIISCLLNELGQVAQKLRGSKDGWSPSDQAYYTTDLIAAALPYALAEDPAMWTMQDAQPDPDELQRGGGDPAKGGTRLAVALDIQQAYSKLEPQDAALLRQYYINRHTQQDLAQLYGVARVTIQRRLDAALGMMQADLGGGRPTHFGKARRLSETEHYAARQASRQTNASAIAQLQETYNG